jgi:hypothetical protein
MTILPAQQRHVPWWPRLLFVCAGLALWFWSQSLIGRRSFPDGAIGDQVHIWTAPWHDYLLENRRAADLLLITSSAVIDLVGVSLLVASIVGKSVRPFLALLLLFALRQACQGLCSLPAPDQMIWHKPGFPTLLVTYGVATDLFFSGHTGLAVLGAVELARTRQPSLLAIGIVIALFEGVTVLVLRAHYTMDVFAGAVTALLVAHFADRAAPFCDRALARLGRQKPSSAKAA